jgi:hypothetical protein
LIFLPRLRDGGIVKPFELVNDRTRGKPRDLLRPEQGPEGASELRWQKDPRILQDRSCECAIIERVTEIICVERKGKAHQNGSTGSKTSNGLQGKLSNRSWKRSSALMRWRFASSNEKERTGGTTEPIPPFGVITSCVDLVAFAALAAGPTATRGFLGFTRASLAGALRFAGDLAKLASSTGLAIELAERVIGIVNVDLGKSALSIIGSEMIHAYLTSSTPQCLLEVRSHLSSGSLI